MVGCLVVVLVGCADQSWGFCCLLLIAGGALLGASVNWVVLAAVGTSIRGEVAGNGEGLVVGLDFGRRLRSGMRCGSTAWLACRGALGNLLGFDPGWIGQSFACGGAGGGVVCAYVNPIPAAIALTSQLIASGAVIETHLFSSQTVESRIVVLDKHFLWKIARHHVDQ